MTNQRGTRIIGSIIKHRTVNNVPGNCWNTTRTPCNPTLRLTSFICSRTHRLSPSSWTFLQNLFEDLSLVQNRMSPINSIEPYTSTYVFIQSLFSFPSILLHLFTHSLSTQPTNELPWKLFTHAIDVLKGALFGHFTALALGLINLGYWCEVVFFNDVDNVNVSFAQLEWDIWYCSLETFHWKPWLPIRVETNGVFSVWRHEEKDLAKWWKLTQYEDYWKS